MCDRLKHIAVFASGTGTNFKQIHSGIQQGSIPAVIDLLVSNNPNCQAVSYANDNNIRTAIINSARFASDAAYEQAFHDNLNNASPDLIVLAGFMKLIPESVVRRYSRRILNVHPALLPLFGGKGFYGMNVHRAVIKSGMKISGVTVHFVDENYDSGPILAQKTVPVMLNDNPESLAAKVLKEEHMLFPEVVKAFCEDRVIWDKNKPFIED